VRVYGASPDISWSQQVIHEISGQGLCVRLPLSTNSALKRAGGTGFFLKVEQGSYTQREKPSESERGNNLRANQGIQALIKIYKNIFRIPENLNHYSEKDYRAAERKFLKQALEQRKIEMEEELLGE
jgi:hypothetical protein